MQHDRWEVGGLSHWSGPVDSMSTSNGFDILLSGFRALPLLPYLVLNWQYKFVCCKNNCVRTRVIIFFPASFGSLGFLFYLFFSSPIPSCFLNLCVLQFWRIWIFGYCWYSDNMIWWQLFFEWLRARFHLLIHSKGQWKYAKGLLRLWPF